jgi:phage shock protein E
MKQYLIAGTILAGGISGFVMATGGPVDAGPALVVESQVISESIPPADFAAKHATGEYVVIDVRTPEEYAAGKVFADAALIDFYAADFRTKLSQLDKDQSYLIYCRSGNRTGQTLNIMKSLGFTKVYDLAGGKNAWEQSGRQLVVG